MKKKVPTFRSVKTVGALARQLAQLPQGMKLDHAMQVTVFNVNVGEDFAEYDLKPCVGLREID